VVAQALRGLRAAGLYAVSKLGEILLEYRKVLVVLAAAKAGFG
jgi:hypothetical protein